MATRKGRRKSRAALATVDEDAAAKTSKSTQGLPGSDTEALMDEVIKLRSELAEERAERINMEATLAKAKKKLGKARQQRSETEAAIHETTVDTKRKLTEAKADLKKKESEIAELKEENAKWRAESLDLREKIAATTGSSKKIVDSCLKENCRLKDQVRALEEELRQTKIDLKFSKLTGTGWRSSGEPGSQSGQLRFNAGSGSSTAGPEAEMNTSTAYIPIKSTQEIMSTNRYVRVATTRKEINQAISERDEERLNQLLEVANAQSLESEAKAIRSVIDMIGSSAEGGRKLVDMEQQMVELKSHVDRLVGIEREASSLRNATASMGMALESEQEARGEIERELDQERRSREQLADELVKQQEVSDQAQADLSRKLRAECERVREQLAREKRLRKKAETELYRSSVAITDYRKVEARLHDEQRRGDKLQQKLDVSEDKCKKLEKVMYRSSVVMFQQVDKRLDVERQARLEVQNRLEMEKEKTKHLELKSTRLARDLEKGLMAEASMQREARKDLEKVVYKSSVGIYKQLQERMQMEEHLRKELNESKERCHRLERKLRAEEAERRRAQALMMRSTNDLERGMKDVTLKQQRAANEIALRSDAMAAREQKWDNERARYSAKLEEQILARRTAQDKLAQAEREAELLRMRLKAVTASAQMVASGNTDPNHNTGTTVAEQRQVAVLEAELRAADLEIAKLRRCATQADGKLRKAEKALLLAERTLASKANEISQLTARVSQLQSFASVGAATIHKGRNGIQAGTATRTSSWSLKELDATIAHTRQHVDTLLSARSTPNNLPALVPTPSTEPLRSTASELVQRERQMRSKTLKLQSIEDRATQLEQAYSLLGSKTAGRSKRNKQ